MLETAGFKYDIVIIWKKDVATHSIKWIHRHYCWIFEPIFYMQKGKASFYGSNYEPNWIEAPSGSSWAGRKEDNPESTKTRLQLHPAMKPLQLIKPLISKSSAPSNIVLDLFGGSGSTLIACEQTGRVCYMMEIDPRYCQVIVDRWQKYTGQKAVKNGENIVCENSH